MIYLSELLNKRIYYEGKIYGEMIDFAVLAGSQAPSVSKIVVRRKGKKITISPSFITIKKNGALLASDKVPFLPYDERDFYLNEDLLDKQVIDIDDKRLVRVNDILLEGTAELKIVGIDIGAGGLLRRLGLERFIKTKAKIIPWQMIEAFDYQTGNVKLSLTQNRLNRMHPSELADILEELGSKERRAMIESLDSEKAADAIEEANLRTQEAILDEVSAPFLKKVVNKIHVSNIADLLNKLNPLRIKEITHLIGAEKVQKIQHLLHFENDKAGGLMRTGFISFDGDVTVKEAYNAIYNLNPKPDAIIVTNGNQKLVGTIYTKDILSSDSLALLKDIVSEKKFVRPDADLKQVISLFGRYNLRLLPVVDEDKKPIGSITTSVVLSKIEEMIKADEIL